MQQRSFSKQNRPQHQMAQAYQEGGLATGQQNFGPTSITARKYIRTGSGPADGSQQQPQINTLSQQKLTAPIKSLQWKHKHLEMQLAQLSAQVANQASQQDLEPRRKFVKQTSAHISQNTYASPADRQSQPMSNKIRISSSKDRSASGNKRIKPYTLTHKISSPQRFEQGKPSLGQFIQNSGQKMERKRPINEIIDNLKKNNQGAVMVKLSNRGSKPPGQANNTGAPNTITSMKMTNAPQQQRSVTGNSATRQYYAGTSTHAGANASIDLSSQQHNVSLNNGSSSRGLYQNVHNSGAMTASAFHPIREDDLNQQQLINLQGNTAAIIGPDDSASGLEAFQDAHMVQGTSQIGGNSAQLQHSHLDAAQTFENFQQQRGNFVSPDRQLATASHLYQRQPSSFSNNNDWQAGASLTNQVPTTTSPDIVRGLENGILSLHSHLKTLEGKYIDLANYYKQELITQANQGDDESVNNQRSNARASSSSVNQRKLQNSNKKLAGARAESSNYMRRTMEKQPLHQSQFALTGLQGQKRSNSKTSVTGLRGFEELKDQQQRNAAAFKLDQAQERCIIEEVKTQKQKLENEMRNLIGLYTQICDEESATVTAASAMGGGQQQSVRMFKSHFSHSLGSNSAEITNFKATQSGTILNQILAKYQNQLLTQSEYEESYEKSIERTFGELFEELSEFCQSALLSEVRSQTRPGITARQPNLSLMERIEKLGGDYDIQQEYSLSNLKETMFQIQHANDQFQLDIKKISLDFNQIQKKMLDQDRGLLTQLQSLQSSSVELQNNFGSIDELAMSLDQVSHGLNNFAKRVCMNEQKLGVLQENHGESVRYLREYRDNFRSISSEYQLHQATVSSAGVELSGDHGSINQSYSNAAVGNHKYQAEITSLNQEVFLLRTQLADAKQNGLLDLNDLRDKLDLLNNENASLHSKVTDMNHEIQTKQSQLTQREHQNADLARKLESKEKSVEIQTARVFEDYWRQNCQSMVDLSQKFLHSMRRLQKVVHRKETNVQQEKSAFEAAKKELEVNLKEVKRNLEGHPQLLKLHGGDSTTDGQGKQVAAGYGAAAHSTSARPMMAQSAPSHVVQENQVAAGHAQSMRAYMPGLQSRPVNLITGDAASSDQRSAQKVGSEQSQVPHRMGNDSDFKARFDLAQKELQEQKSENVNTAKKLQKERQKVQNLLTELKMSQENLQKVKLTFVPQENVTELESSIRQLQGTISSHQTVDEEHLKTIQELKMSVYELNRIASDCQNKAQPDFSAFMTTVAAQVNDLIMGQANWLHSIEQHLNSKEQQMGQMTQTVDQVSRVIQEKNQRIVVLISQNTAMSKMIENNQELLGQAKLQATESEANMNSEVQSLRSDLKVKQNGNRMLGALMRAFKKKLDEEMCNSRQLIEEQTAELEQFVQVINQRDSHVQTLSVKVEKKRFKSAQQRKVLVQTKEQLEQLQAKVGSSSQELVSQNNAFVKLKSENEELQSTLKVKRTGNVMLNALMRAFKSKLEEEMASNRQVMQKKTEQVEQFNQVVQQQSEKIETLQAKIEKTKWKKTETRKHANSTEQSMLDLQSKVTSSQKQVAQVDHQNDQLQAQVHKLNSDLKVKANGNKMLGALMRAFKDKLQDEMRQSRQVIEQQTAELDQFSQVVQERDSQVQTLSAKVDKKKFKSVQQKHVIAQKEEEVGQLEAKVGAKEQDLAKSRQLQEHQAAELNQRTKVIEEAGAQMQTLAAKVEKKRFKSSQQKQALAETQDQVGSLHAKVASNEQDLVKSRQLLEQQAAELEQRQKIVVANETKVQTLTAKVEKKRFKSTQQKQVLAQTQQEFGLLQAKAGSSKNELQSKGSELAQLMSDNQRLSEERVMIEQQKLRDQTEIKQLQNELEATKSDAQLEAEELLKEIETLETQLADDKDKYTALREDSYKQEELMLSTKQALDEQMNQAGQLEERNAALEQQHKKVRSEMDANMEGLRQERDQAQAQLSEFINQHQFEKESLEGKLQHQLNQTMAQLDTREDECEGLQKQLALLKEANSKLSLDLNEQTQKMDKKKQKLVEFKGVKEVQDRESREDKAALQESRDLVVQFKSKIEANEHTFAEKNEEIQNLRDKLELTIREASMKETTAIEMEEEIGSLKGENTQYKDQIAHLKTEFSEKASQLEAVLIDEQRKLKEKDELITEADALLEEFNHEKHEVKAKFKHLMELLSLKAAGSADGDSKTMMEEKSVRASQPSSYKGRDGEVDLNHCFEELEQIVLEFKDKQESRIVELLSDKEQLAGTVHEHEQDLQAMQVSLAELQAKLDEANSKVETNDGEARRQIDTAMRKISNYKTKVTDKKQSVAVMEAQIQSLTVQLQEALAKQNQSDSGIQDSFLTLQKENMQLLQRLQKTEGQLQNKRNGGDDSLDESRGQPQKVTLSPEVITKLDKIDERMMDMKRELHSAKFSCLKDLTNKFAKQLKSAQRTFVETELLSHAVTGDKVTGWNNMVKECKSVSFEGRQFLLVQDVSKEANFYLVDLERVTETAAKYLKSFVDDYDDDEFIQDVIGQSVHDIDEESEVEKLKALVTDLRQDRIELQAEIEQFREGVKSDMSRLAHLKDEEMKDDIEYLTGENKELYLKVKEVCMTKASLQLQLAEARKQIQMQEDREEMSAIVDEAGQEDILLNRVDASDIETARNIGLEHEMFNTVQEAQEENSRMPDDRSGAKDCMSENDSVLDVVNQMDQDNNMMNMSSENNEDIQQMRQKLQSLEEETVDLKMKLHQAHRQIEDMHEQKEQEDDDSGQSLIPHIKVTLIQFLRSVVLTDRQNEDLLTIIFGMMEFTEVEIQELKIARINIKMVKGSGKPARAASSSLAGNSSANSMSKDADDGSAKPRRGLFGGMFGGKKKDPNMSGGANKSGSGSMPPQPRPAPRR